MLLPYDLGVSRSSISPE